MSAKSFANLLVPLGWAVLVGGWALAIAAFFVIGSQTCTTVTVPLAGNIKACQDTTAQSVILLAVVGFAATVGSLFIWALRHVLSVLAEIETNTKSK